ncbi:MAG: hypothetical protein ACLGHM_10255, partial [Actinomycetes bacterium]
LTRPAAIGSLAATLVVAGGLYWAWVRAGRPRGAALAVAEAEASEAEVDELVEDDLDPGAVAR